MPPIEPAPEGCEDAPWKHERYRVLGLLGRGSFGDVYLARDLARGHDVAVKVLRHWDPVSVAQLRREFRALKHVEHPNLVQLFELHADDREGFLTMEVVDGLPVVDFVRAGAGTPERRARARRSLAQLVAAVGALHTQGTIHRDLKPTNALVTGAGRVVVLDAGLAKSINAQPSSDRYVCGTPGYMSPEQAVGRALSEASDWYSLGVIAYELFTDRLPFESHPSGVLFAKLTQAAPSVSESCPDLAATDARMIDALLAREPEQRPKYDDICRWLEVDQSPASKVTRGQPLAAHLVGRQRELCRLDAALGAARETGVAFALVSGPSGIGKTTLVKRWMDHLDPSGTIAFAGRCYQRETVLFSGFEDIFDSIAERISHVQPADMLSPDEIASVELVFGTRFRLDRIALDSSSKVQKSVAPPEPLERRRLVGRAFSRILAHLAQDRTLVLWLDDLQWGGVETAMLLADILRMRFVRGCLLVASCRPLSKDDGACLSTLRKSVDFTHPLDLGPIGAEDAAALVEAAAASKLNDADLAKLVSDAAGHPLLLQQAALHLSVGSGTSHADLGRILSARVEHLSADGRKVLSALSVAGEPIPELIALHAVGLDAGSNVVRELLRTELVHRIGRAGHHLMPFHDQLREIVLSKLSGDDARELNIAVADALEQSGQGQPESLVGYYLAAGERRRAAQFVSSAAAHMAQALAFDRAAKLFRISLDLAGELGNEATQKIRLGLADALVNCGRVEEGARVRLQAAALHGGDAADHLVAQAASELIRAGRIDEGLRHARQTFHTLGLRLSSSGLRALPSVAVDRSRIAIRGLRYQLRPSESIRPRLLQRIDWCLSLGLVLSVVDTFRAFQVHNQGLLSALEAGEPARLGQAFAMEAGFQMALGGGRDANGKVDELLLTARMLAEASGSARSRGIIEIVVGSTRWSAGDWPACVRHVDDGVAMLRRHCAGVSWEVNFGQTHALDALRWMGALRKVRQILSEELDQARARGDLFAETMYTLRDLPTAHLVADRVQDARECSNALQKWPNRGFQVEHMVNVYKQTEVDLYEGNGVGAMQRIEQHWVQLSRSQLMRLQPFRIELLALRARAIVAAATQERQGRARSELVRLAARVSEEIDRELPSVRGDVFGAPVAAAVASLRGDPKRAVARLESGIEAAARSSMRLHENALRFHLGRLLGGEAGQNTTAAAVTWMRSEDICRPDEFARMLCPAIG